MNTNEIGAESNKKECFESLPVAYIRPIMTDRGKGYAVCSADGDKLAIFATQDAAFFAAKQHDLDPVLIH